MKAINVLSTIILVFISFSSCRRADVNKENNTVHQALSSEVSTLDPAMSYDVVSASVIYQAYEPLFEYHYLKRPYTLQPLTAAEMPSVSADGLTYTIKIKKNIRYHDNPAFKNVVRTIIADDYITQIKRLAFKPTKSTGWWLFDGKIQGINDFRNKVGNDLNKMLSTPISGLTAIDKHTLKIKLTRPYPQLLYALAMSFTSPMPAEVVKHYDNKLHNIVVGTGPFYLEKWNKQLEVILRKFTHYRESTFPSQGDRFANDKGLLKDANKKIPFVEKMHFHIIKEANTRWLNFLKNKVDFLVIDKDNFSTAIDSDGSLSPELQKKNIKIQVASTLTFWWLAFNMQDPLFGKNKNLRLAFAHAIDVDRFIELFTNNVGQKANSIYAPGIPGYSPSAKLPYSFNLNKAKEFLSQAGYPNGKGLPVIRYDVRGSSSTARQMADFFKSQLLKIGVDIQIITNTFPAFLKKAREGKLQFWRGGWAMDYPDAENILQLLITKNHAPGPNSTFYSNSSFDKDYDTLAKLENDQQKFELMKRMEQQIHDELPWAMMYYSRSYILHQSYLKNYRQSDLIYNYGKYLRIENK